MKVDGFNACVDGLKVQFSARQKMRVMMRLRLQTLVSQVPKCENSPISYLDTIMSPLVDQVQKQPTLIKTLLLL